MNINVLRAEVENTKMTRDKFERKLDYKTFFFYLFYFFNLVIRHCITRLRSVQYLCNYFSF